MENQTKVLARTNLRAGTLVIALVATILFAAFYAQNANAMITSSLDLGSQGSQVTELQTYLATNASIYPEALVTGYFGALTQAAVQRFQTAQGIVSSGSPSETGYGRVGPTTMARINSLNGGVVVNGNWDTVPAMSTPTIGVTATAATINWATNENTTGQLFWSTSLIQSDEQTGPNQLPYISGTLATDAGGMTTSHSVTVSNLQSNTVYYYVVRSIDTGGNIAITLPATFRTNSF